MAEQVVTNLQYGGAYKEELEEAQRTGECPFCKDQTEHPEVILHRANGWFVKEVPEKWRATTLWPKKSTEPMEIPATAQYLLIPEHHIVWPDDLTDDDWLAIGRLSTWVRKERGFLGGTLHLRSEEPTHPGLSGRTVFHLHAHLTQPPPWPADVPNPQNQVAVPIPIWCG